MKKLLLILAISLSFISLKAEEGEIIVTGEWQQFAGFEGGVGYYTLSRSAMLWLNPLYLQEKPFASSWGYNIGYSVGWQKNYDGRLIGGLRNSIAIRANYTPHYKNFDNTHYYKNAKDQKKFPLGKSYGLTIIFSTDFFFDFQATERKRQGILLGLSGVVSDFQLFPEAEKNAGASFGNGIRFGYRYQIGNRLFDLVLEVPIFGFMSYENFENACFGLVSPINTTLTLGYKFLF